MAEEIARGAEAIIYRDGNVIVKERPIKAYRNAEIDARLRTQRTRKEAKILALLEQFEIPGPSLIDVDDKKGILRMSLVSGVQLKEVLDKRPELAKELGIVLSKLHNNDIIHGDVTTSNIMYTSDEHLACIDFGLAAHTTKIEDKAVDLHLLRQSLTSKHVLVEKQAWKYFLEGYHPLKREEILDRLRLVEKRGRNKI